MKTVSNRDFPMERETKTKRTSTIFFLAFVAMTLSGCEEKLYDCTRHDDDGNLKYIVPCDGNGVYHGEYLEYHKTGKLWERRFYVNGLQEDTTRYFFYKTGEVLKEVPMKEGKKHGLTRQFREDGTVLKSETFVDGYHTGPSSHYYESGSPRETIHFEEDQKTGPYFFFAEDSTVLVQGEYYQGGKYGKWTHFDYDGTKLAVITYYNDKKEGGFTVFNKEGMPYTSGNFEGDYLSGDVNFYDAEGSIVNKSQFRKGRQLNSREKPFRNGRAILPLGSGKTVYIMPDTVWINQ